MQKFVLACKKSAHFISGFILVTYGMRYPHVMHLLWNKMPYFLLKTPKTHAV